MTLLEIDNVSFTYPDGDGYRTILNRVNQRFDQGTFYAIVGASGSGKTTFLTLIAGMDQVHDGNIRYNGKDLEKIGLWKYRRQHIGMVFQNFNLIPYMTGLENVLVAMGIAKSGNKASALKLLDELGISVTKAKRSVRRLSGGEQQRVAIARALANNPDIIIADEPSGNLDGATETAIIGLFQRLARDQGKCVIVVTHSEKVASNADIILRLHPTDGTFEKEIRNYKNDLT
jgi:putative ABC transport system ATP-binding protein